MWLLICLFGNRLLFCFMAFTKKTTIHSLILAISALYFRTCFVSISESLEESLSAAEMLFCLCRQWDICSVTDGWRVAAGPCIADLTNAVQTRPGILYAVCVSVTDSLHVTVWPLSSDPRSRHVTIHLPLWHEWLSSTTDPSSSPQGAPGAVGLDRDLGSLWNRRNSHTFTFHRSITCHCCHWKLFFLLTVLRLAWVFRHFCNTLSWGKHFRSQWRI